MSAGRPGVGGHRYRLSYPVSHQRSRLADFADRDQEATAQAVASGLSLGSGRRAQQASTAERMRAASGAVRGIARVV
jgi:hypothetical protein